MELSKSTYSRIVDSVEVITRIDFSINSNNDILRQSVIEDPNGITVADIYYNGEPVPGGTFDKRLGVIDSKLECSTCKETALGCPGHFGHIKLVEPVFHMGFLQYIKNILSCICIRCHKLLVYKNEDKINKLLKNKQGKQRFAEIKSICKSVTHCQKENYGCGAPAHKITIDKKYGNVLLLAEPIKHGEDEDETKKRSPHFVTPQQCYNILRPVTDEVYTIMGFDPKKSRPEDMIITNFPVPPVQIRPSIRMEIGSSSTIDDDLTHKLIDIIKNNENLKNTKGDGSLTKSVTVNDDHMLLQFHVATFFANDILGLPRSQQKNKKVTKSLSERLKGKEGRVRGNLMGKRVDMSSRSVITPDPKIGIGMVGVPLIIAKNLTYPEIVTKHNIEYLTQLVKNGRKIYPGANYVIKNVIDKHGNETKYVHHLKYQHKTIPLHLSDIVERHLITGDVALFNRQPSLHKLSMMGHIIHVINDPKLLTFRLNVNVTEPYNADFDGDEMNLHPPQSILSATETRLIASAAKRFINPSTSRIAINAKQDTLMGSHYLTYDDIKVDWKDVYNILMSSTVGIDIDIPKNKKVSGKLLFSLIIPTELNIVKKKPDGSFALRIRNGVLTHGIITKSDIGLIIQKTWFRYGSIETQNFLDDLQNIILQWLMRFGFTIGIKSLVIPDTTHKAIKKIIEAKRKQTLNAITEYENDPYVMSTEAFEISTRENLRAIQDNINAAISGSLLMDNSILITNTSGSSGNLTTTGQTIGCIGQVFVENRRIQKRFNNRTLPTFYQHDDSAFARGFCYNSFLSGLNPMEFFFHAMGGREGVIATAIKTSDIGYTQRKLIKIMEDIKVEYDGTVRNANDKIIQLVYGDNGINTEKQIEQKISLMAANNATVRESYTYTASEIAAFKSKYTANINDKLYDKLTHMRDRMRRIQRVGNVSAVAFKESFMMPVDIQQFLINITNRNDRVKAELVDPHYVLKMIHEMYSSNYSKIMKYNDKAVVKRQDEHRIKLLLKLYLYDTLAPKKCTHVYKLTQAEFDEIVEYFKRTIMLAKVEGGEMVGFVGAQSIGEPITQLNLKSFHLSGVGGGVSLGLPRAKELLGILKNIKTPVTKIILEDKYKNDKIIVSKIASYLKYTTFRDIVATIDIYYDPNPDSKDSVMKRDDVTNVFADNRGKSGCQEDYHGLPWIIRLVLSKDKMIERNVSMLEMKTSFCHNWIMRFEESKNFKKEYKRIIDKITQCAILTNFDNSPTPIMHIRFDANNYNFNTFIQFQEIILNKYRIKGIPGIIESNNIEEETYIDFDEAGNVVNKKHYVIITQGVNPSEIAQINGINLNETICNHIVTIYETYGVEAARTAFIREFTMALESAGSFSNYQHIEILTDAITHNGGLIAVNRHGANKLDTDPFSRASFEKTVEQLLAAAAFGESDHVRSVSARIMMGVLINGGTGCFDLLLDHVKIKKSLVPEVTTENVVLKKKTIISDLIKRKQQNKTAE